MMRTREPLLLVAAFLLAACSAANGGAGTSAPVPSPRASEDPRLGNFGAIAFVHGESSNQDLRLEVSAVDGVYSSGDPIEVFATVEALDHSGTAAAESATGGPAASPATIAFFGSAQPVGFGVEEVGGNRMVEPVFRADCAPTVLEVGVPRGFPFVKSGGTAGGPNDAFARQYLNITDDTPDPELRLPAGTWRIYATTQLQPGGCSAVAPPLEASITIVVSGPDPSPWPHGPQRSPAPGSSPSPAPSPTRPPAGVVLPYPDGCAAFGMTELRCEAVVAWAKGEAGLAPGAAAGIALLALPDDVNMARLGGAFVVRVRVQAPGVDTEEPLFCGVGGDQSLLCNNAPHLVPLDPISNGYYDVPCSSENGPCATVPPTADPTAIAAAQALNVAELDIPIDHVGSYHVPLGQAQLANGVLRAASAGTFDEPAVSFAVKGMLYLDITDHAHGKTIDNIYRHPWRPGTELVDVWLDFNVYWFAPGSVLRLRDVHVE